jgi:hypothetical protein
VRGQRVTNKNGLWEKGLTAATVAVGMIYAPAEIFPDGVARITTPGDTPYAHGRRLSNVDLIDVAAVPEPATWHCSPRD